MDEISNDRVSGSTLLTNRVLDLLSLYLVRVGGGELELKDFALSFRKFLKRVRELQPSMFAIQNMVDRVAEYQHTISGEAVDMQVKDILNYIAEQKEKMSQDLPRMESNFDSMINQVSRINTLSMSSAVIGCVSNLHAKGKVGEVIVCESRPGFEGRRTAALLSVLGIHVTLIVDSAMRHFCDDCDFALIGADAILGDGSVLNKIGSRMLALSCKDAGIPFYVAAETMKVSRDYSMAIPPKVMEKPAEEVAKQNEIGKAVVKNIYFEVVPSELITSIVTEEGIFRKP